jgi:Resolvase, N terminal domain/Recombinase
VSACQRLRLPLLQVVRERQPNGRRGCDRPALSYALRRIAAGEAHGLVVSELSQLSRSKDELGEVLDCLSQANARLVAAAQGLDTGEGGTVSLADVLKEMPEPVRPKGRPSVSDYPDRQRRIVGMRAESMSLRAIADRLNEEGVPTLRGGAKWRPSSVQAATGYRRPRRDQRPPTQIKNGRGEVSHLVRSSH